MTEFIVALVLTVTSHALQRNIGLNLADEGFLWNGVVRVSRGDKPVRDFESYDPARYYWIYLWSKLFGLSLMGIRRSLATCQVLALWAGLAAASRAVESLWLLCLVGVLLLWWMQPRHKYFDHAVALTAVYVATVLIETPTYPTVFVAGVFVGIAGMVGVNHGFYCFISLAAVLLAARIFDDGLMLVPTFGVWLLGIAIGYAPVLTMWLLIPDMLRRHWQGRVMILFQWGSTNVTLPAPWPWKTTNTIPKLTHRIAYKLMGLHFVLVPLFYAGVIAWLLASVSFLHYPLLAAAVSVGVMYAHFAYSRADLEHLCQAIQPFLLGVIGFAFTQQSPVLGALTISVLLIIGFLTVRPIVPLMTKLDNRLYFVETNLHGQRIWLPKRAAKFLAVVQDFVADNLKPDESIFIAPRSPGLYPILRRTPPTRNDFNTLSQPKTVQRTTIGDLERIPVNWALIWDIAVDGRDDLRLKNTHPLLWNYLEEKFVPVPVAGLQEDWQMLRRKDSLPAEKWL